MRRRGRGITGQAFEQHDEPVAALSRDGVAGAHAMAQPIGRGNQQRVADRMAARVVDPLEVVEVEEHQRAMLVVAGADGHRLLQPLEQQPAVGQVRQRVVEGQRVDALLGGLALGDVGDADHMVRDPSVVCRHRRDRHPGEECRAALAPAEHFAGPGPGLLQCIEPARISGPGVCTTTQGPGILADDLRGAETGGAGVGPTRRRCGRCGR